MFALLVHQIVRNCDWCTNQDLFRAAANTLFFQLAKNGERNVVVRTQQTGAMTMRAWLGGRFDHTRTQTLAAHFQKTKARNATDLNTGTIGFQFVLQTFFNSRVVLALIHIDEVDNNQTGQIAQTQLASNLFGRFKVGLERGFLDRAFFGRFARVHIDRNKCFSHADHNVAARFQLNGRIEHCTKIAFHLIAGEKRQSLLVVLHVLCVGRHDHLHEVLGHAVSTLAFDQNFVDLAVIKVADRAFDQIAFFVDFRRGNRMQCQFADLLPKALQVFVVSFDLGLGALGTGSTNNQPCPLRNFDSVGNFLELFTVCGIGNLTRDTTTTRGVWHQNAVATSKRQIGCQSCTLVAALFFNNLHQQDLANLDNFLDFVTLRTRFANWADIFFVIVVSNRLDALVPIGCLRLT